MKDADHETPNSWSEEDRQRALSLYSVLVLFVAFGLLVTIFTLRSQGGIVGARASPRELDMPTATDPLEGLPSGVARLDSSIVVVPPLIFRGAEVFPCTECHDDPDEEDFERRELKLDHKDLVLDHGSATRWCFDCHAQRARDSLHLASGALVSFQESFLLCAQCHGRVYRDWQNNVHGKRTGYWNGAKRSERCEHCHDPHSPRFKRFRPLRPPSPSSSNAAHSRGREH